MFDFLKKKTTPAVEKRNMSISSVAWGIFTGKAPVDYLEIGTVYACIRMLSDSIAMTPLNVYKDGKNGRDQLENNPLTALLERPAPNTTAYQWLNTMTAQLTGWGNAYSVIEWAGSVPKSLIYIPASRVSIQETTSVEAPYYYRVTMNDNSIINVFPDDMIHFRNITVDGYTGISPITLHASTFNRGYYEGEFATNFMKNGGSMSGIITTDKKLKPDQVQQLKTDFSTAYGGAENAGKTPVLADGMKYVQLKPVSPADADYVRSKELTKAEIMEIFKVPPPLLGVIDATYNNTEQLALIYQRYTLSPIYTMIQQEMTLKLTTDDSIYLEFEIDVLLNATANDKAEVITKLTEKGIMTPNEARRKYNLKDMDGLNEVILPLNLAPLELHKEVLTPVEPEPVAPEPVAPDPEPEPTDDDKDEDAILLERQLHKLQSEVGRIKKQLGNVTPLSGASNPKKSLKGK